MPTKVEISYRTILFVFIIIATVWFLHEIKDVILLLFVAFILTSALNPLVDRIESWRFPRSLAILLLYLIGLLIIGVTSTTIFPPLIGESVRLGNLLPNYFSNILSTLNLGVLIPETLSNQLGLVGESVFRITLGVFSNIITTVTILVFTFYLLLERKHLESHIGHFVGEERRIYIVGIIRKIEDRLGAWVRGELALMVIVGVASYAGLTFLQIDYALPLAIIAGLLEIVPVVGPIISAVPAIAVALSTSSSPVLAFLVTGLYFVIQQLENHFIVPTVMRRAVDLPPVVTLVALIIGGKLGGTGGAVLAVPLVVTLRVILAEIGYRKE